MLFINLRRSCRRKYHKNSRGNHCRWKWRREQWTYRSIYVGFRRNRILG
nr:MAG TPA: hypothetical protein [Caudoviricetes sp.]